MCSQIILPYYDRAEVFPVFSWSLFSSCNSYKTFPEIEILLGDGNTITNKLFPRRIYYQTYYLMQQLFKEKDQDKADKFLNKLLHLISRYLKERSFRYKIFKSKTHLIKYIKQSSLKKEKLFKEGVFNQHMPVEN